MSGAKRRRTLLGWSLMLGWIALPWALWQADNLALFALHQLYHLPLAAWIGAPFFRADSEVMFVVEPAGRVVTALFYLGVGGVVALVGQRWKKRTG